MACGHKRLPLSPRVSHLCVFVVFNISSARVSFDCFLASYESHSFCSRRNRQFSSIVRNSAYTEYVLIRCRRLTFNRLWSGKALLGTRKFNYMDALALMLLASPSCSLDLSPIHTAIGRPLSEQQEGHPPAEALRLWTPTEAWLVSRVHGFVWCNLSSALLGSYLWIVDMASKRRLFRVSPQSQYVVIFTD